MSQFGKNLNKLKNLDKFRDYCLKPKGHSVNYTI